MSFKVLMVTKLGKYVCCIRNYFFETSLAEIMIT